MESDMCQFQIALQAHLATLRDAILKDHLAFRLNPPSIGQHAPKVSINCAPFTDVSPQHQEEVQHVSEQEEDFPQQHPDNFTRPNNLISAPAKKSALRTSSDPTSCGVPAFYSPSDCSDRTPPSPVLPLSPNPVPPCLDPPAIVALAADNEEQRGSQSSVAENQEEHPLHPAWHDDNESHEADDDTACNRFQSMISVKSKKQTVLCATDSSNTQIDEISESDEEAFEIADYWVKMGTARRQQSLRNPSIAISTPLFALPDAGNQNNMNEKNAVRHSGGEGSIDVMRTPSWSRKWLSVLTLNAMMSSVIREPYSRELVCWEFLGCIMVLYDIISIPLDAFPPPPTPFWDVMPWVVRIYWTADILLSFVTGYVNSEGTKIMTPKLVAKRYATRQLPFDLFVVSADWTDVLFENRFAGFLKVRRIFRIARFVRLKKAKDTQEKLKEFLSSQGFNEAKVNRLAILFSVTRVLIGLMLLIHVLSCSWYAASSVSYGHANPTWVEEILDRPFADRYLQSFHFAMALFLGEHAALPQNSVERLFVIAVLFSCFFGQIWLISVLTTSMTHLEIVSARRTQMFNTLERYMVTHQISRELALRVHRNADHALKEQDKNTPEEHIALLQLISEPLLIELHYEIYSESLFAHPFFRCYSMVNPAGIRSALHAGASFMGLHKGDVVFVEGEMSRKPDRMLMINTGQLSYLRHLTAKPKPITDKNWLCEGLLWVSDWVHLGTCRSESDCKLMSFDVETFQQAVGMYPSEHVVKYAHAYVRHLNDLSSVSRTDVGEYTDKLGGALDALFKDCWQDIKWKYELKVTKAKKVSLVGMHISHSGSRQSGFKMSVHPLPDDSSEGCAQRETLRSDGSDGTKAESRISDWQNEDAMIGVTKSDIAMLREKARVTAENPLDDCEAKRRSTTSADVELLEFLEPDKSSNRNLF